jgi:hypothetical protein
MTLNERADLHDRQIAAIRNLVKEGISLVVETRPIALETRKDLREVVAIQKRTEQKLETLINTMKRGANGHSKRRVDIGCLTVLGVVRPVWLVRDRDGWRDRTYLTSNVYARVFSPGAAPIGGGSAAVRFVGARGGRRNSARAC